MKIDTSLVKELLSSQFPHWGHLPITPVEANGWDNDTFHLGSDMLIRLPSAAAYAPQVEKEHHWLPKLAPFLPLQIPHPIAMGMPTKEYSWNWSIYKWLPGKVPVKPTSSIAKDLAHFLTALYKIDTTNGPLPGPENFYRGGSLSHYDGEACKACALLKNKKYLEIWEKGLQSSWENSPVWVHGDISRTNLLIHADKLSAVIDFGQLAIGDPACDLMIYWTFLDQPSRKAFRSLLPLDPDTWDRARAWALWKSAVIASGLTQATPSETTHAPHILETILQDTC